MIRFRKPARRRAERPARAVAAARAAVGLWLVAVGCAAAAANLAGGAAATLVVVSVGAALAAWDMVRK